MTWAVPGWWSLLLLALAAWRTFRLLAEDTILDRPREWIIQRAGGQPADDSKLELFIRCPYCAGFWIALAWWAAWQAWPHWTLVVAAPFAISAVVALVAVNADPG